MFKFTTTIMVGEEYLEEYTMELHGIEDRGSIEEGAVE